MKYGKKQGTDLKFMMKQRHELTNNCDKPLTIVIGAGLAGVSTAYALAARGVSTLLIDEGPEPASGSSHANAGMLTSSMSSPWNSPGLLWQVAKATFGGSSPFSIRAGQMLKLAFWGLSFFRSANTRHYQYASRMNFRLAQYSMARTRALRTDLNLEYDSDSQGTLKIFRDQKALSRAIGLAKTMCNEGLAFSVVTPEEIIQIEPMLASKIGSIIGGIYYPDDESGDANKFTQRVFEEFVKIGGEVRFNTCIARIVEDKNGIVGVETSAGIVDCKQVVVAAGHASVGLLALNGISLPIKPVKGYSVTFECKEGYLPRVPVVDDGNFAVVTPLGSRLRVSGFAEFAGNDDTIDDSRVAELVSALDDIYPSVGSRLRLHEVKAWTGLRPVSADGLPFIGGTAIKGLFVNTGHGHLGWTMAAGSGHLLADHMLGQPAEIDIRPYQIDRDYF